MYIHARTHIYTHTYTHIRAYDYRYIRFENIMHVCVYASLISWH